MCGMNPNYSYSSKTPIFLFFSFSVPGLLLWTCFGNLYLKGQKQQNTLPQPCPCPPSIVTPLSLIFIWEKQNLRAAYIYTDFPTSCSLFSALQCDFVPFYYDGIELVMDIRNHYVAKSNRVLLSSHLTWIPHQHLTQLTTPFLAKHSPWILGHCSLVFLCLPVSVNITSIHWVVQA